MVLNEPSTIHRNGATSMNVTVHPATREAQPPAALRTEAPPHEAGLRSLISTSVQAMTIANSTSAIAEP